MNWMLFRILIINSFSAVVPSLTVEEDGAFSMLFLDGQIRRRTAPSSHITSIGLQL